MEDRNLFCNKTLVGNWYEDRLHERKSTASVPRYRQSSVNPIAVTEVDKSMYRSSSHSDFLGQRPPPLPSFTHTMIHPGNMSQTLKNTLPTKETGRLTQQQQQQQQRELYSTTHSSYGGPYALRPEMRYDPAAFSSSASSSSHLDRSAGQSSFERSARKSGLRSMGATGESLRLNVDPREHTFVQRSWQYNRDVNVSFVPNQYQKQTSGNVPGCALKGLGENDCKQPEQRGFARRSDTLKAGIQIFSDD